MTLYNVVRAALLILLTLIVRLSSQSTMSYNKSEAACDAQVGCTFKYIHGAAPGWNMALPLARTFRMVGYLGGSCGGHAMISVTTPIPGVNEDGVTVASCASVPAVLSPPMLGLTMDGECIAIVDTKGEALELYYCFEQ